MKARAHSTPRPLRVLRRMPFRVQLLCVALLSVAGVMTATAATPRALATYQTYSCASCASVSGSPDWVSNAMTTDYTSNPYSACATVAYVGGTCNTSWYTAIYCAGFQTNGAYGIASSYTGLADHLSGHEDNYTTCG